MNPPPNIWLLTAAAGSFAAALAHIACLFGGPDWFRFFGAGEAMARAVEQGRIMPYVVTIGIAVVLLTWTYYALAAAGQLPRPPLLRTGLIAITAVLLVRAAAVFAPDVWGPDHSPTFQIVSSLIVLALGLSFLLGTIKAWPILSMRT